VAGAEIDVGGTGVAITVTVGRAVVVPGDRTAPAALVVPVGPVVGALPGVSVALTAPTVMLLLPVISIKLVEPGRSTTKINNTKATIEAIETMVTSAQPIRGPRGCRNQSGGCCDINLVLPPGRA
jgi:hypothetical protein